MSHHLVEAQGLGYTYPDGTTALREVSFRVTHGESVGIVGANGAGKSTLLLHVAGVLMPTAGTLRVGNYLLTERVLRQVRRTVGMVFQDPDDQLFMPTVRDDVAFGPLNMGLAPPEIEDRVRSALETVGAAHLVDRPPYRLSGGEKRAVAIATVLSMSPDMLVMDEPTAGLDPVARRGLLQLLATFTHTKLIAGHDLDMILELCARTIVLHEGRVTADGPTRDILRDDELLSANRLERPLRLQACPICGR